MAESELGVTLHLVAAATAHMLDRVDVDVFDNPIDPESFRQFLANPMNQLVVAVLEDPSDSARTGTVIGMASAISYVHPDKPLQLFVNANYDEHYFTLRERPECDVAFRRVTVFDYLVNNADRKGGHILLDTSGHLWSIDHGICFHNEYKLRTVIWDFAGEKIPRHLVDDLVRLQEKLDDDADEQIAKLRQLLSEREIAALRRRLERLIQRPVFPQPGPGRHYPWPPV